MQGIQEILPLFAEAEAEALLGPTERGSEGWKWQEGCPRAAKSARWTAGS